ncbi:MAG: ABC transporter ATP-binding protein [Oscillospiraceae bacterium]|nr:ABC transporter ATP-binding protein [Oscillospiraceae bacterium]
MLKIKSLTKSYKGFPVLKGLNMSLEKGDVYGFLGKNGCGKTTTMNIICNIIAKDEGEVNFAEANPKIGYLPETPALYGYMNAVEYLDFIGACCRYEGDIQARTAEVLEITGMKDGANRLIKGYSRGMNQRIGIAAALYAHPELIILDEPTSALDPAGRAEVMEVIRRLADGGATIILCTHILADVERVANKVGILNEGVMQVEGLIGDVKKQFDQNNVIRIALHEYPTDTVNALRAINLAERHDFSPAEGITIAAKAEVTEKELYNKVILTLADLNTVPEKIEFKRQSLEDIYIGITTGYIKTMQNG